MTVEYGVLYRTKSDTFCFDVFPLGIEDLGQMHVLAALNSLAKRGWRLVAIDTGLYNANFYMERQILKKKETI